MTLSKLLVRLDGVKQRGNRWSARCPAHADKSPSLSLTEGDKGLLLKCWAGCSLREICSALQIQETDLFFDVLDQNPQQRKRPAPTVRVDRRALAFQYDLAALDLRLREDRIVAAGKNLDVAGVSDDELDRAIAHAMQAHADVERAELFEGVADDLRFKEFLEKDHVRHERIA